MILLLGTKEVLNEPQPEERPKFIEDMTESELSTAVHSILVFNSRNCS